MAKRLQGVAGIARRPLAPPNRTAGHRPDRFRIRRPHPPSPIPLCCLPVPRSLWYHCVRLENPVSRRRKKAGPLH